MTLTEEMPLAARRYAKGKPVALNGGNMVAQAMRQTNPDLVAAYPITPQTIIMEAFSEFVANGEVDTEFLTVESEHSAMSACIGACAAGARVQTATSSAGLAYMWEMLYIASGCRLPIVMHMVNRALSAPLNIHCDHSDSMGARDSSWIQLFAENGQEAYDNALQCVRIAEHPEVLLPAFHTMDGFTLSHAIERGEVLPDEVVRRFLGTWQPKLTLLDVQHPATFGPNDPPDYYFEHKRQQQEAMDNALRVIVEVGEAYAQLTGRQYGLVEGYRLSDADYVIVVLGSTAGTIREAVDDCRERGIKAGLLKVRSYRPFPAAAVAAALTERKVVAVLDRSMGFGAQGNPLFLDVGTALFSERCSTKVVNYVYGLGGRDTIPSQICQVFSDLVDLAEQDAVIPLVRYIGLKE